MKNYTLNTISFETIDNYETNLEILLKLIDECDDNSIIVAPEVCLSGYDYDNFEDMVSFSEEATKEIKKASKNKIIILTMLERRNNDVYNFAKIFYNGEVVYEQAKAKLFKFGDEHKYMKAGREDDINIVEVDGIKIAILICFELRFKSLWQRIEGADIIAIPAWWGKLRLENFKTLTQAIAVMNQCYVIASDSKHDECTKVRRVINPFGLIYENDAKLCVTTVYDTNEIKKMRKYMDVGIK